MRHQVLETGPQGDGVGAGPLGPHINPFIEQLVSLGYRRATIRDQRSLVRTFDRWIARRQIALTDVDERTVDTFRDAPAARRRQRGSGSTLQRLLAYLRAQGVTRPTVGIVDDSPLAQLERRYQHYLRDLRRVSSPIRERARRGGRGVGGHGERE